MIYGSVCSGIESATIAWEPLGWEPEFFAEVEPFPNAVLQHYYPNTSNFGDFTKITEAQVERPIDVLVGGTPCQSFSVAGRRAGLDDPRGNLALEFLALARRLRPKWVVWENVPGILSLDGGRTFGTFLGLLGQLGYGFAYRVLDAQFVRVQSHARAVPQRRRRLFVVGHLGDWRGPAAVLLEPESLRGDSPPRREAREDTAGTVKRSLERCSADEGECGTLVSNTLNSNHGNPRPENPFVPEVAWALQERDAKRADSSTKNGHLLVADPVSASEAKSYTHEGRGNFRLRNCVPIQNTTRGHGQNGLGIGSEAMFTLDQASTHAIAFDPTQITSPENRSVPRDLSPQLTESGHAPAVAAATAVRRLTPRECERLQGFPDDYTLVPYRKKLAADGPRYKALGNAMAVNVMRWIGERIAVYEAST